MEFQQKLSVMSGWFAGLLSQVGSDQFPTLEECLGEDGKGKPEPSGPMDAEEARSNMRAWITVMNASKKAA